MHIDESVVSEKSRYKTTFIRGIFIIFAMYSFKVIQFNYIRLTI